MRAIVCLIVVIFLGGNIAYSGKVAKIKESFKKNDAQRKRVDKDKKKKNKDEEKEATDREWVIEVFRLITTIIDAYNSTQFFSQYPYADEYGFNYHILYDGDDDKVWESIIETNKRWYIYPNVDIGKSGDIFIYRGEVEITLASRFLFQFAGASMVEYLDGDTDKLIMNDVIVGYDLITLPGFIFSAGVGLSFLPGTSDSAYGITRLSFIAFPFKPAILNASYSLVFSEGSAIERIEALGGIAITRFNILVGINIYNFYFDYISQKERLLFPTVSIGVWF